MFKRAARIQFPDDTGKTVRVRAFPRWIGEQSRCRVWCPGNYFWPALTISTQVAASCVSGRLEMHLGMGSIPIAHIAPPPTPLTG